jgi:hypothetical protein
MQPVARPSASEQPTTVRVEHSPNGLWEVELPDRDARVACETFNDALRIGYLCAAHARPCELVVHDAYHRVVQRRVISGAAPDVEAIPHVSARR